MYDQLNGLRETYEVRESVRRSMQGNASANTGPEQLLRRSLWSAGCRGYRKNVRSLPGSPDIVFPIAKLAVFVHGCFWHGCRRCTRNLVPKTNAAFWRAKVRANKERDARNTAKLKHLGFHVLTLWECELAGCSLMDSVTTIASIVKRSK